MLVSDWSSSTVTLLFTATSAVLKPFCISVVFKYTLKADIIHLCSDLKDLNNMITGRTDT